MMMVPWIDAFWVIVVLVLGEKRISAQNNVEFDPDENNPTTITHNTCSIPPYQDYEENYIRPTDGMCGTSTDVSMNNNTLDPDVLQRLAEEYAPVLYFHPLEAYTMSSVDITFRDPRKGKIYVRKDGKAILIDDQLNVTRLLLTSQPNIRNGRNYFLAHDLDLDDDQYKRGSGFDAAGFSLAPIYYNVIHSGYGTLTFNYFFYYTYNGPIAIGIGIEQYTITELAPYGEHEGDWEAMSVLVCQPTPTPSDTRKGGEASSSSTGTKTNNFSQPLAISYKQHSFAQITDCTKGQCIFYKQTNHPVGFVAHNSHATYPKSTRNMVYVHIPFVPSLYLFLSDLTIYKNEDTGNYRQYFPNSTNLIRLIDPQHIQIGVTDESFYWMGFGGAFGNRTPDQQLLPVTQPPRCMNLQQSKYLDSCPKNALLDTLVRTILARPSLLASLFRLPDAVTVFLQRGDGPFGPAQKTFYNLWEPPEPAQLWDIIPEDITEETFCDYLGKPANPEQDLLLPSLPARILIQVLNVVIVIATLVGRIVEVFI